MSVDRFPRDMAMVLVRGGNLFSMLVNIIPMSSRKCMLKLIDSVVRSPVL